MSIYIPGMKMPKEDGLVDLRIWGDGNMNRLHGYNSFVVPGVKAFEVPPHGRLIDADKLIKSIKRSIDEFHKWANEVEGGEMHSRVSQALGAFVECSLRVKYAPTIIPASEVKNND